MRGARIWSQFLKLMKVERESNKKSLWVDIFRRLRQRFSLSEGLVSSMKVFFDKYNSEVELTYNYLALEIEQKDSRPPLFILPPPTPPSFAGHHHRETTVPFPTYAALLPKFLWPGASPLRHHLLPLHPFSKPLCVALTATPYVLVPLFTSSVTPAITSLFLPVTVPPPQTQNNLPSRLSPLFLSEAT